MARLKLIFSALLLLGSSSAMAFSGSLAPPTGWTPAAPTATPPMPATLNAQAAAAKAVANASSSSSAALKFMTTVEIGAQRVSVPAAASMVRPGAFLARRMALALTAAGGPIGIGIAGFLALAEIQKIITDITAEGKVRFNPDLGEHGAWEALVKRTGGYWSDRYGAGQYPSPELACNVAWNQHNDPLAGNLLAQVAYNADGSPSYADCTDIHGSHTGTVIYAPLVSEEWTEADTERDVVPAFERQPFPVTLPEKVPFDWPVEAPKVNPLPDPFGAPSPSFIPIGSPVDGKQPGVKVTPTPTPDDPFSVQVDPVDNITPDQLQPPTGTASSPTSPASSPGLCDLYPDIVACKKLDEVPDVNLETKDIDLSITPDSGWGASTAACPAPQTLILRGKSVVWSYQPYCDFASQIRPVVIAVAWMVAALIVARSARG